MLNYLKAGSNLRFAVVVLAVSAVLAVISGTMVEGSATASFFESSPLGLEAAQPETTAEETNSVDLQEGLQGYWRFDNPEVSRGYSLEFDGQDDNLRVSSNSDLAVGGNASFSFWIKRHGNGADGGVDTVMAMDRNYWVWIDRSSRQVGFENAGSNGNWSPNAVSSGTIDDGEWNHVVLVRTNSTYIDFYINGEKSGSDSTYMGENITSTLYLGSWQPSDHQLNATLDSIRIYNRSLSSKEAEKLFESKLVSREELVFYQDLNEGPNDCDLDSGTSCLDDDSEEGHNALPEGFDAESGWVDETPVNRPSIGDYSKNSHTGRFYGGNNGKLKNFEFSNKGSGWVNGRVGQGALEFDGKDDSVRIQKSDVFNITGPITLTAWVKVNDTAKWPRIVEKGNYDSYQIRVGENQGATMFVCAEEDTTSNCGKGTVGTGAGAVTPGEWTHIAGTWNGETAKIFVDGNLEGESSYDYDEIRKSTAPVTIADTYHLNGTIDDVRIYARSLSSSEIKSLYEGETVTEGLVGRWNFEAGNRKRVYDVSGFSRTGVLGTEGVNLDEDSDLEISHPSMNNEFTVSSWVRRNKIGTRSNPGNSCYTIKNSNPEAASGYYWISPKEQSFLVYCDMEKRGGGWTMLMKLEGESSTFGYSSDYWENKQTLNTGSLRPEENIDVKLESYYQLNITQIRAEFPRINHNMNETLKTSKTPLDLFSEQYVIAHENESGRVGEFGDFDKEEFAYQSGYQDYGFKLNDCNREVRWGWVWNNEEDTCDTVDAIAGIGLTDVGNSYDANSGSVSTCCSSTPSGENTGNFPLRSIMWGREAKPVFEDQRVDSFYSLDVTSNYIRATIRGENTNKSIKYTQRFSNDFFHVSVSYNGSYASLYVDGNKVKDKELNIDVNQSYGLNLGSGYVGSLDETKFYNRSLSDREVKRLAFR